LKNHNLNIALIIFFVLSTTDIFAHGLENYYQFGLQGEYFYQDSYSGMNLNFVIKPKDEIITNNIILYDFMFLRVNANQYNKKIRANFTLFNINSCNIDTIKGINFFSDFSIGLQHSEGFNSLPKI
jgi:hypothetical protein